MEIRLTRSFTQLRRKVTCLGRDPHAGASIHVLFVAESNVIEVRYLAMGWTRPFILHSLKISNRNAQCAMLHCRGHAHHECLTCRIARHGGVCTGQTFNAIFRAGSPCLQMECTKKCLVTTFKKNSMQLAGCAKSAPCAARSESAKIRL